MFKLAAFSVRLLTWEALLACLFSWASPAIAQISSRYGQSAGTAKAVVRSGTLSIWNELMSAHWSFADGMFTGVSLTIRGMPAEISLPKDSFTLIFRDGTSLAASKMSIMGAPRIVGSHANPLASRRAERLDGQSIVLRLQDPRRRVLVIWRGTMRDDSNYFREEVAISATKSDQVIAEIRLFDSRLPGAKVAGTVRGSPITAGDVFLGFEHPLAQCEVPGPAVCSIKRELPLKGGKTVRYSLVVGASQPGQMRRSFLYYLEQERPRSYSPFLHYNSWYDIGYGKSYDAAAVRDVIEAFGKELVRKRGVKLDSFLLDDGWDDPKSLWHFNSGFPSGIAALSNAAQKYGAGIGVWLSPWGGYSEAKEQRLKYAVKNGFETTEGGLALSGPKYYARFREVTRNFIQKNGINQFKIDGTGNVNTVFPGSRFDSDFAAAINLIQEWRAMKPDLYINLTTGTYPSPFWLLIADSIWRGGEDHSFAGVGSWRERWITYRDGQTYRGVVKAGPLFPLNSVMLHGLIYARRNSLTAILKMILRTRFGHTLEAEHSSKRCISRTICFPKAIGTCSRKQRTGLSATPTYYKDTHWVGGDPLALKIYGWAAWSPREGILTLRNPSDRPQSITLDIARAFELPRGAPQHFCGCSPWSEDKHRPMVQLSAGQPRNFLLVPFQVVTMEMVQCEPRSP